MSSRLIRCKPSHVAFHVRALGHEATFSCFLEGPNKRDVELYPSSAEKLICQHTMVEASLFGGENTEKMGLGGLDSGVVVREDGVSLETTTRS